MFFIFKVITALFLVFIATLFAVYNSDFIIINFGTVELRLPLFIALYLSLMVGFILAVVSSLPVWFSYRHKIAGQKIKLRALQNEMDNLKTDNKMLVLSN